MPVEVLHIFSQPSTSSTADSSMVTCFSYGRKGHKAPACPDRVGGHRSTPSVTPKTAPTYQLTVRTMRPGKENELRGMVGNIDLDFVLDTGASVSMVPQSCVSERQMTGECVVVEDANGGAVRRPLAKVDITLKGLKCESEVVVAPDEILKGKVLFAMCLNNPDHRQILCSWEDVPVTLPVRAMATRAMVAAKVSSGVEEAAIIAVEQPRCTPMTGMPSTLVDGEKQVCQPSTLVDGERQVGNWCQPSTCMGGWGKA